MLATHASPFPLQQKALSVLSVLSDFLGNAYLGNAKQAEPVVFNLFSAKQRGEEAGRDANLRNCNALSPFNLRIHSTCAVRVFVLLLKFLFKQRLLQQRSFRKAPLTCLYHSNQR